MKAPRKRRRRSRSAIREDGMTPKQRAALYRMTPKQRAALERLRKLMGKPQAKPGERTWPGQQVDDRPHVQALLAAIHAALPRLCKLLDEYSDHWHYEDPIYRFYCGSFKIYGLQKGTAKVVRALRRLLPKRELSPSFTEIVERGTGKTWALEHNSRWEQETAPIVEAFFHARYFLEMAVRYGQELKFPPTLLPSGWAGLLCLYQLR